MSLPLSIIMITKNAAAHLDAVLAAVAWCDDIVVVDSGSSDATCAIVERHGARLIHHDWLGFGPQKRFATTQAKHNWVLNLDADEVLDEAAQAAIQALPLTTLDASACFALRRRTFIGRREIRHGPWNPDWCLRLYNRTRSDFDEAPVHEVVVAASTPQRLAGTMLHYSFTDLVDVFKPHYARSKAAKYVAAGRRAGTLTLALRFNWALFQGFVLKRGFLDGGAGFIVAVSHALNASLGLALASAVARQESDLPDV
ncbi:MAG: glycosyltransferase family 2 protein [Planctomycetota bacterium]|jgi:glycosyltransferase involved in cell wall biosynthesis|nr:glycosyltransferase family 2 protein [Planctomycetota bacterium]